MSISKKYSRSIKFILLKLFNHAIIKHNDRMVKSPGSITSQYNIPYDLSSEKCKLDIHRPMNTDENLPAIIYYHGGGWAMGDKSEYTNFCKTLAAKGFTVFNTNYVLTAQATHPSPIKTCIKAAEWISKHAEEYNSDKNNIYLCGDSAGGHIAGLLGALCTNSDMYSLYRGKYNIEITFRNGLRGLGILCGANDMRNCYNTKFPYIKQFTKMLLDDEDVFCSPIGDELCVIGNITSAFPATFLSTTVNDPIHSESTLLEKELINKNIPYKMLSFDKSHKKLWHVYQVNQALPESQQCMSEMTWYFHSLIK